METLWAGWASAPKHPIPANSYWLGPLNPVGQKKKNNVPTRPLSPEHYSFFIYLFIHFHLFFSRRQKSGSALIWDDNSIQSVGKILNRKDPLVNFEKS